MALIKKSKTGTKYSYARIGNINYNKEQHLSFVVQIIERDSVTITEEEYKALHWEERATYEVNPQDPKIYEPLSKSIGSMNFDVNLLDKPIEFSSSYLNEADHNLTKSCYGWLKINTDLFSSDVWTDS